jgi:hypothetical protein
MNFYYKKHKNTVILKTKFHIKYSKYQLLKMRFKKALSLLSMHEFLPHICSFLTSLSPLKGN